MTGWDEFDESAMEIRRLGGVEFPSRVELEALIREEMPGVADEAEIKGAARIFALGAKAGVKAQLQIFQAHNRSRAVYVRREQRNDITNLWGLIP